MFTRLFFILMLFIASASLPEGQASQDQAKQEDYRIGIGDLLQIEVYDEPDLTREVRVLTDGYISLPLLGRVRAAERTVSELQNDIDRRLGDKYLVNPQVTVFVKEFSNIFVFGEVKNPGSFPLTGTMTVFEAVTLAGGFTEVANPSKVKIIRTEGGQQVSFEVNIQNMTKNGDVLEDRDLRANDRVIVPRSFF
jgi:protein involved in polysaccharide export with SLBB domain